MVLSEWGRTIVKQNEETKKIRKTIKDFLNPDEETKMKRKESIKRFFVVYAGMITGAITGLLS